MYDNLRQIEANQWTGFYMITTSVMKVLIKTSHIIGSYRNKCYKNDTMLCTLEISSLRCISSSIWSSTARIYDQYITVLSGFIYKSCFKYWAYFTKLTHCPPMFPFYTAWKHQVNVPILYPLNTTPENQRFSGVFRG